MLSTNESVRVCYTGQSHPIFLPSTLMQHFVVLVVCHAGGHRFRVAGWCYELDGAVDEVIHQAVVIVNIAG